MKTCPFFNICGGCKYDFADIHYREKKLSELSTLPITDNAIWTDIGTRRRVDFAFADGKFGLYQKKSKNIIPINNCPLLHADINKILQKISELPWSGGGSCLITKCDNGIDVAITSTVPYFSSNFKNAIEKIKEVINVTWNEKIVKRTNTPMISFDNVQIEYISGAFLQPTIPSENIIRNLVVRATTGAKHTADLFCGLGNFTFALNADGFDISGNGIKRDLFTNPLTVGMLSKYDCVVMDPPRAGAIAQCKELVKSTVSRIIYVSCNPITWNRDASILTRGGYKMVKLTPIDQFVGSSHWELFSVFNR